jgi:hypothetical protein
MTKFVCPQSDLLIFFNIVVHIGMFHGHMVRQIHIIFYFNCFSQHILVHCCLYYTAHVIKNDAYYHGENLKINFKIV